MNALRIDNVIIVYLLDVRVFEFILHYPDWAVVYKANGTILDRTGPSLNRLRLHITLLRRFGWRQGNRASSAVKRLLKESFLIPHVAAKADGKQSGQCEENCRDENE